ncbi:coiled-coil domain-containing protein 102A-like [Sarcoptes scabiei]|uniref:DNA-directed RNA polymerases I, II, and III subunit RPABC5 n=1 Tax=Sarcoptes scabiei TaxID=52283 RepID=A0A132A3R5_SARSC|nr:RNA polymerase-like protein [Sarcoptes scabiei]UXI19398.1 coiled-coil domain-containing protein 102A-like [Sarcoptes scabiei]
MFFPVRCWTCGKVIGHLWEEFREELNRAKICNDRIDSLLPLFQKLGLRRFCCHTMFLTHYQRFEESINFSFPENYKDY